MHTPPWGMHISLVFYAPKSLKRDLAAEPKKTPRGLKRELYGQTPADIGDLMK